MTGKTPDTTSRGGDGAHAALADSMGDPAEQSGKTDRISLGCDTAILDSDATAAAPLPFDYPVEVIRSAKRRRYISTSVVDGVVKVRIPDWMSHEEETSTVAESVAKLKRKYQSAHIDLAARARSLAAEHDLPVPVSISWSSAAAKWGSCAPSKSSVRIADRLARVPPWVLDYVIVHELAHLVVPNHGPEFQALVDRYRLADRAQGYLLAVQHYWP